MHQRFLLAIPCLLLCLCVGCGTGEYQKRLAQNLGKSQKASKFNQLYGLQKLAGTSVSIRMPLLFTKSPLVEGAMVDGKPVDARRVKPGLVELPGLKLTYEGAIRDAEGGELPYYCYVGTTQVNGDQAKNIRGEIHGDLSQNPQYESLTNWVDFQGETSEGRKVSWEKLRFVSDQDFYYRDKNGQERFVPMPGMLEVYLHEEAGFLTVLAWRMPVAIERNVGVAELAAMVAGSVSVQP